MRLVNFCKLLNTLGADGEVTASRIGDNFSIAGAPDYQACKFDNGIRIDANTEIVQLTNTPAQYDFSKGMIGFWVKLTVAITNGVAGGGLKPRLLTWWLDATHYVQITFHNTLGLIWNVYDGVSNKGWNNTHADLDIGASTAAFLLFAWNINGIAGGANIRRCYLNGGAVGTENTAFVDIDMTTAEATIGLLYNGAAYSSDGEVIIDNIVWFSETHQEVIDAANLNKDSEQFNWRKRHAA